MKLVEDSGVSGAEGGDVEGVGTNYNNIYSDVRERRSGDEMR
jgi:hypothetical protein